MTRVADLQPGDLVTQGGESAVFIVSTQHHAYRALRLVIWRLDDGTISADALAYIQEVGEVTTATPRERYDRLMAALG